MAAGFEQQDYKGATNTVLGFSWLLSWLHETRGCSWQTAEADTLRFHPRIRGAAILFPYHHSSYFSSVKSLFHFKRQVKQYQGSLEVSFLPYLSFLFCPSSARSQPLQYIPTTVPFPSSLCLKSSTRRSVNYLRRERLQVGSVLTPRASSQIFSLENI